MANAAVMDNDNLKFKIVKCRCHYILKIPIAASHAYKIPFDLLPPHSPHLICSLLHSCRRWTGLSNLRIFAPYLLFSTLQQVSLRHRIVFLFKIS